MSSQFANFPAAPRNPQCQKAFVILCNAHDTASSLLDIFVTVRQNRGAMGTPTDEEQDLLRACLMFASAGLDSMAKQLICNALPAVVEADEAASKMFLSFIEKHLRTGDNLNYKVLASVVVDESPRERLLQLYVDDLIAGSLQSVDALFKAGAAFDVKSSSITTTPEDLRATFLVRNQIVHEMDVDFDRPNRNRTPRAKQVMIDHTNRIFSVAAAFLISVDAKITAQPSLPEERR